MAIICMIMIMIMYGIDIAALTLAASAMRRQMPSAGYAPIHDAVNGTRAPLQLVGVTTVWGNRPLAYVNNVTINSMRVLGLSHVPVYSGAAVALMPGAATTHPFAAFMSFVVLVPLTLIVIINRSNPFAMAR